MKTYRADKRWLRLTRDCKPPKPILSRCLRSALLLSHYLRLLTWINADICMCFKPPLLLSLLQMVFSEYVKLRILYHANMGYKGYTIPRLLEEEGIKVSTFGVYKFLKVYEETGTTV